MQYTISHYYRIFHCTAEDCPDTCCAGWQIQIDPASLKKYRRMKSPLGSRLKNEIDWKEGCFHQYDDRCAFLNDQNLCDLYLEGGGEKVFCRTCRTYPRHIEEFEGIREISLSLSCPVAARMILTCKEPVRFLHAENPELDETYEDFNFFLFTKLADTRSLLFRILQNRSHSIQLRAAVSLALTHDLQERIDKNALFDVDSLLERYSSPNVWQWFQNRLNDLGNRYDIRCKTEQNLFRLFDHLEVLRKDWNPYLNAARRTLKNVPVPTSEQKQSFSEIFTDITVEQLLVYFVFTYFCGAVYSGNAYVKMKFSFAGMILIRELVRAQWLQNPDQLTQDNLIRTAWRYAREVEHSDFNKIKMEKLLDREDRFGLEYLFSLL